MSIKSGFTLVLAFGAVSGSAVVATQEVQAHPDCYCDGSVSSTGLTKADGQEASLLELIDAVCADQDSLEEGEQPPAKKAIADLKTIIVEAAARADTNIPVGDVAIFFGELSVTWRYGNRMLRATTFSDPRTPRLDFGTTPEGALGTYEFDTHATGAKLVEKLQWLRADGAAPEITVV
jgi:hypothetical protein